MTQRTTIEQRHLRRSSEPLRLPRYRWYPIARSRDVVGRPRSMLRLGRAVVLWRDADGRLHAHDARCPHRGADLGLGRVVGGELECPYHGFRFAADGHCAVVPCEPADAKIRRDLHVRRHEAREHRGLVWLWHGESASTTVPLPWFDELPGDDRHAWDYATVWPLSQLRVMEGMLDLHHAPFAHRRWLPGMGTLLDPYEVKVTDDTVKTRGTLRRPDRSPERGFSASVDARLPGLLRIRFGSRMQGLVAVTPIDRDRTWLFVRYFVEVPVLGKLLAALGLWAELALIQTDDQRLLLSSSPHEPDVHGYKLVRADLGIAQWHKLFAQASSSPASAGRVEAASGPSGT